MALSPVNSGAFDQGDTAVGGDVLAEVNNILNNALTLISPLTGNLDCNAKQLVSMIPETVTSDPTGGTAGETYYQSTSKQLVVWNGTAAHTYVTRTVVETLTNKTLTQPRIGTNIRDTNGNELMVLTATASAVNELTLANAATGNNPSLTASGDDSNISINLVPKGTGVLRVNGTTVATATNTLTVSGKTFSSPVINTSISGTAIGGTPTTQAVGDSAASGSSGVITRLDHKHGMPSFGTVADSICQGNDSRLSNARTPTGPTFSVHKNGTTQTGVVTGTWTLLTWSTEDWDSNSNFASNRFTPTVAGKYCLIANAHFTAGDDGSRYRIRIYKNGSGHKQGPFVPVGGVGEMQMNFSCEVNANGTTDYFEVYVHHNTSSDKIIGGGAEDTFFQGHQVSN